MKLRADQFLEHLGAAPGAAGRGAGSPAGPSSTPLERCYLLSGDEPLLLDEAVEALRVASRARGCEERESYIVERGFDWDRVRSSLDSLSLFSSGKLVELRLPNAAPGDEGSRRIREISDRSPDGNVVAVITPALNRKTAGSAWASALASNGVWVELPGPGAAELPRWIARRLRAAGLRCEDEGIEFLAAQVEGNLLAARQEIDKLALLHPAGTLLTVEQVRDAVVDGARFDVFQLADAALAGESARAVRVLEGLREEGVAAPLVLWALVREALTVLDAAIRASRDVPPMKAVLSAGVWQSRADVYVRALRRHKPVHLRRLLSMSARADRIVKGAARGEPWNALLELTLALAGHTDPPAELAAG